MPILVIDATKGGVFGEPVTVVWIWAPLRLTTKWSARAGPASAGKKVNVPVQFPFTEYGTPTAGLQSSTGDHTIVNHVVDPEVRFPNPSKTVRTTPATGPAAGAGARIWPVI